MMTLYSPPKWLLSIQEFIMVWFLRFGCNTFKFSALAVLTHSLVPAIKPPWRRSHMLQIGQSLSFMTEIDNLQWRLPATSLNRWEAQLWRISKLIINGRFSYQQFIRILHTLQANITNECYLTLRAPMSLSGNAHLARLATAPVYPSQVSSSW